MTKEILIKAEKILDSIMNDSNPAYLRQEVIRYYKKKAEWKKHKKEQT